MGEIYSYQQDNHKIKRRKALQRYKSLGFMIVVMIFVATDSRPSMSFNSAFQRALEYLQSLRTRLRAGYSTKVNRSATSDVGECRPETLGHPAFEGGVAQS